MEPINLDMWPMFEKITGKGHVECFLATKDMKKGDMLFLHVGTQNSEYRSGIYAVGEIQTNPYILHNSPDDYCNEKNTVDVKIIMINYNEPILEHSDCTNYISQFRTTHMLVYEKGCELYNIIFNIDSDLINNKKRVETKKQWLEVLKNEKQDDNLIIDILLFLYDCKNYTSNGKTIANYFKTDVAAINSYVKSFGKRVIDLLNLEEQIREDGSRRRWNVPFETIPELNKGIFTWKLRKELVEALVEFYGLDLKEYESLEDKIKQFIEEYPYDDYCESIEKDLKVREEFVKKFPIAKISNLSLEEFVIGRAEFDEKGRDTFCYILERRMQHLGQMLGSFVSKFGVWYSKKDDKYDYASKYGSSLEEAFNNLKKEICSLLVSANNNDFEAIEKNKIADLFKGKILSTYYPDKHLCIFNEEDVNKFLNLLNINYDVHEINTLEKKKRLLVDFKNNNKYLSNYSDYYFILFLYRTFKNEVKIKNTVSGEIDYNIEFVDFEYLKNHESSKKNSYRSRNTDYERINRNKKDVGNRGEKAILQYEINKLKDLGLNELAKEVAINDNDGIGYDIDSFDEKGNPIHIEVKTNSSNKSYLDFYITDKELQKLIEENNYYIYYLFNIKGKPKCHIINKEMILKNNKEFFQPVIYKVNVDVLEKE